MLLRGRTCSGWWFGSSAPEDGSRNSNWSMMNMPARRGGHRRVSPRRDGKGQRQLSPARRRAEARRREVGRRTERDDPAGGCGGWYAHAGRCCDGCEGGAAAVRGDDRVVDRPGWLAGGRRRAGRGGDRGFGHPPSGLWALVAARPPLLAARPPAPLPSLPSLSRPFPSLCPPYPQLPMSSITDTVPEQGFFSSLLSSVFSTCVPLLPLARLPFSAPTAPTDRVGVIGRALASARCARTLARRR